MKSIAAAIVLLAVAYMVAFSAAVKTNRWPKPSEVAALSSMDVRPRHYSTQSLACASCPDPEPPSSPQPPPSSPPSNPPPSPPLSSSPPSTPPPPMQWPKAPPVDVPGIMECMERMPAAKECYGQILTSYYDCSFHVNPQCCDYIVKMNDQCQEVVYGAFNDRFFASLLQSTSHVSL